MKPLWIMLLSFTIYCAFAKYEGVQFPQHFFPFSNIEMILSEYLWTLGIRVIIIGCAWAFVNGEKSRYLSWAAWVITGWGVDFILEANTGWFVIGRWVISYETLIVFALASIIIKEQLDE